MMTVGDDEGTNTQATKLATSKNRNLVKYAPFLLLTMVTSLFFHRPIAIERSTSPRLFFQSEGRIRQANLEMKCRRSIANDSLPP